ALSADGRRIVARVVTPAGAAEVQVIDAVSGRVTPRLSGAAFGRIGWMADGRRVFLARGGRAFAGNPDVSDQPQPLPLRVDLSGLEAPPDSATYTGWHGDTLVVMHTDGRPERRVIARSAWNAISV